MRIHMSDGAAYDVQEPWHAHINQTEMYVGIDLDEAGLPGRSMYLDTRHVTRIEPLPGQTPTKSNGR